ncbi:MAG TPA: ATPase [Methanobacteriales archaeon]|nr:ATPase [Methanobacteriaceae archaeon]MBC7089494.1 ATPase [Methanobacteriaceae archaeon]MBC7096455.1 ATPase [Methanobacteriales archaeon]HIH61245.1 ATPase [Methanobacteriales archaeon]
MIVRISSGIPGLDELIGNGGGSFAENTVTLIYGPPKVGKSVFSYQFAYEGLRNNEPCLYISTDYGLKDMERNIANFGWNLNEYIENENFYLIDAISTISGGEVESKPNYLLASVHNPTDIMVKLGMALRQITSKLPRFRSVLDSLTTLMAFNDEVLIVRVLTIYIMRIKESGGTAIVTYTEGSADSKVENMLKAIVDNIIHLDGENLTIEAMIGSGKVRAPYNITSKGIIVD